MNQKMIEDFLIDNHARFTDGTTKSYRISLNQFFSYSNKSFDEIKARDIRAWMASMEEEGLKPKSVQSKLTAVKSFYCYCMEENKINKNPVDTVKTPKKEDSLPYYLERKHLTLLQELTRGDLRDRAIVEALYATGLRISELLNIKLSDIKWETKLIWIRKGKGNKERFVIFTHDCSIRLQDYLENRKIKSDYLFCNQKGNPLTQDTVQKDFRDYSKELNFRVTPHTLRHTFAAHLAEKGMDFNYIQELLGHEDVNSTRIYTRLMDKARKKQYDQYQT